MAASTRSAMRLLSPRLQCLRQPPAPAICQIRYISSRYSNPSKRGFAGAPAQPSSFLELNPALDTGSKDTRAVVDERRAAEQQRRYHITRMGYAGMGLLLSLGALAFIVYSIDLDDLEHAEQKKRKAGQQLDASSEANANFQGKEVHVIGAGEGKRIVAQGQGVEIELMETGTSSVPHFPRTIYLPTSPESEDRAGIASAPNTPENPGNIDNQEEYTLVGLGIRTVMWIQVYVVGLYIRTKDISALQEKLIHHINPIASTLVPGEKEDLKKKLLDPAESRAIWSELLKVPGLKTAWRVSPTRNTDFGHLRDGFVTGINKRTQEARQLVQGSETEYDAEDFGRSIQTFKGIFSGGKAPKGSILLMMRDRSGAMDVLFQAKPEGSGSEKQIEKLGSVADERISRLIWLGYLGGDRVSSEAARKGVVDGCLEFAGRPVGSVETRVT